jgi:hypothetical protein
MENRGPELSYRYNANHIPTASENTPCKRKPIALRSFLNDILCDDAPPPYTFKAFADFASRTHCTELLDFLFKAKDYRELHMSMRNFFNMTARTRQSARVGKEWNRLLSTFIFPGSPKELNLPAKARTELLEHHDVMKFPPSPDQLNITIQHVYELLIDNVLVEFIASHLSYPSNRCLPESAYHQASYLQSLSGPFPNQGSL